jgi:hypothetical protein
MNPFDSYLTAEDTLHIAICEYLELQYPNVLFYHTPNEGKKSAFERFKASKLRVLSGVSDLVIVEPKWKIHEDWDELLYHGLYLEIKAKTQVISPKQGKVSFKVGKTSDNQRLFMTKANAKGYLALVAEGFEAAKQILDDYLGSKDEPMILPIE